MPFYQYHRQLRSRAWSLLYYQLLGVAGICLTIGLLVDWFSAYSGLVGGMIAVIANLFFASKLLKHSGASNSKKIVSSFYRGEFQKLIITALLFAFTINYLPLSYGAFFLVYSASHLCFWVASAMPWTKFKSTSFTVAEQNS